MEEVKVQTPGVATTPVAGSAGQATQLPGQATTVDGIAAAGGGIGGENLMQVDIDKELFDFESDDTPLMSLMLNAKKVTVTSPEVDHYMIDEERTTIETTAAITASSNNTATLSLSSSDRQMVKVCDTLHVRGVDGYTENGQTKTVGQDLQLFVKAKDATTGNPVVMAVNGPKANATDEYCTIPAIPNGTTIDILSTAMHETQKEVAPDSVQPVPTRVYLQKRGMNQIISDYFDSQKKRIPFAKAVIAERALRKFKRSCNRSLWVGRKGKFSVEDDKTGYQTIYFSEGVRWMFKREMQHTGKWTYEEFVALAKMFYTGADVPEGAICLCGKNFLESIQCIDFSNHPEVQIGVRTNSVGWKVTYITTVFGDLEFKREPTLDKLGLSNSCGIFGLGRLVEYQRTPEHKDSEKIEGHEATRESLIIWNALGLKGTCHMFINGDNATASANAQNYVVWKGTAAPTGSDLVSGTVYYFINEVSLGSGKTAKTGQTWLYTVTGSGENTVATWSLYEAEIAA